MLMPNPDNQILAISANADRFSIEMSAVHLLGCYRVNQVYMCERSGVLKKHLNDTCLGSLYMQDLEGAMTLCEMAILPIGETVLQLQDNWYLVHSPISLTSHIDCLNSLASEVFVCRGINQIHVSPSCRLHLTSHVLIANFAVTLDTVIKHYEWDLDRISFSDEEQAHTDEWLAAFEETSIRATLSQIRQSLRRETICHLEVHLQSPGSAHLHYSCRCPWLLHSHALLSHSPPSSDAVGAPPFARVRTSPDDTFTSIGSRRLTPHEWPSRYL
jgi:hypothetical protein